MDLLGHSLRINFTRANWEQSGDGFALRQTIPYLSSQLYRQRTDSSGATYTEINSGFLVTSITKNGSSWTVSGGTLADLAALTLTNGFGSSVTAASGALSSALVESRNSVFSFYVAEPITVRMLTDAYLDQNGEIVTEEGDVTFYPAAWQPWRLSTSSSSFWIQYVTELTAPALNTIPSVDPSNGDVLGVHNLDSFIGEPSSGYYGVQGWNYPSINRLTPPPGGYVMSPLSVVYGFWTNAANCVWSDTAQTVVSYINLFPYPRRPGWAPAYGKAIYQ